MKLVLSNKENLAGAEDTVFDLISLWRKRLPSCTYAEGRYATKLYFLTEKLKTPANADVP